MLAERGPRANWKKSSRAAAKADFLDKSLARNFQSEAVKALGHASLSDSFLTFAGLVRVLAIDKVQDGVAMGLAYNGTVYNAAIHKAALSMAAVLEDRKSVV